jgi:DNA-binding response OmpR family regulator
LQELKRILIIEDDDDQAFLEKEILEDELNISVDICSSGKEFSSVRWQLFDVIVCDYNLPDTNGGEILRRIRATSDLPLVLLSGRDELNIVIDTLKHGANDYIVKTTEALNMLPFTVRRVHEEYLRKKELEAKEEEAALVNARIQTLNQTLATLAHYINNATTTIFGYAQLCQTDPDDRDKVGKLINAGLRESEKITLVLKELENIVTTLKIKTTSYVNVPDAMFALDERLKEKLKSKQ